MTTINGNRPTFNLGPAGTFQAQIAPVTVNVFVADDLSSYVKDGKLTSSAIEQFKAQSLEEQQRLLQKFATAAKVSGKAQNAQVVVDLYIALVDGPGGAAAAGKLGPAINQTIAGLVPLADAADKTRGRSADVEAAIVKMRSSACSLNDLKALLTPAALGTMTAEEKGLLLQRLTAVPAGDVDAAAEAVVTVMESINTQDEYAAMMTTVGGDIAGGASRLRDFCHTAIRYAGHLPLPVLPSLETAIRRAEAAPSLSSLRAASVATAAGFAASGTGSAARPGSTDTVNSGLSAEEQRKQEAQNALQAEIAASAGAYDRTYTKASADGKLNLSEQYELMSAAGDPSNLVERFMAGDPTAMKLAGSEQGMMYIKELMSRRNSLRDTFNGLLDDENSRRKKMAQSVGQG